MSHRSVSVCLVSPPVAAAAATATAARTCTSACGCCTASPTTQGSRQRNLVPVSLDLLGNSFAVLGALGYRWKGSPVLANPLRSAVPVPF
jgi:hypothetical protein